MANYDSSEVGVLYVRANNIVISYPPNNAPAQVTVHQAQAVKLADGNFIETKQLDPITFTVDIASNGSDPIPIVHPTTGLPIGANTTANQVMLGVLAIIRANQLVKNV